LFDNKIKNELKNRFPEILFDEPFKKHSSMSVGGACDGFINAYENEVSDLIEFCKENDISYTVIGNASNTICTDKGFRGLVICIGRNMNEITYLGNGEFFVGAGTKMSAVSEVFAKNSISGFEPLGGIPGNLGGAIVMNAGAYGGEIKNVLVKAEFIENGEKKSLEAEELKLGYRKSYFIDNPSCVITGAYLKGTFGNEEDIRGAMREYQQKRATSQPLEFPSCGSFFKRPEGYFAGKLIQDSNLKGYSIGGAQISEKHAGFLINKGGATFEDINNLSEYVKKTVFENFKVKMEPEVRFIGEK